MAQRLVCPRCGESKQVELVPFLNEDGRSKVQLTCRVIVHEEPVVVVYDDPTVPTAISLTPADGLVHELDLYDKLESIVMKLERPAEYGIVEHLFAHTYPDDYITLWRRFGHVATHGPRRYTVSAYLARLLGDLWRHGSVRYVPSHGTGRWANNDDLSAWANPSKTDGTTESWAEFSKRSGWDASAWPATALLPQDEIPEVPPPPDGGFWVYDNRVHKYAASTAPIAPTATRARACTRTRQSWPGSGSAPSMTSTAPILPRSGLGATSAVARRVHRCNPATCGRVTAGS